MPLKKNNDFIKDPLLNEICDTAYTMWERGWAERNAGNISCLLDEKSAKKYFGTTKKPSKKIKLKIPVPELSGKAFLVTATGSYFKNFLKNPAANLGVIRISADGESISTLWGYEGGGAPTSELNAHLLSHKERLKADPDHKIIIHTHATELIAMTASHELDDASFTKTLWGMHSECIIVFPEGVGVLPWMIPGTTDLGIKTAEKMSRYRIVIWPFHGIFGSGKNIDETMGLIETVEKSAGTFMRIRSAGARINSITTGQLKDLAAFFNIKPNSSMI
jgi:rhamnulose-1-phosphate aldolase